MMLPKICCLMRIAKMPQSLICDHGILKVPLCLAYSNKETIVSVCQQVAKLFEGLPPAPQVIPPVPAPTRRKRYWTAEEDEFIKRQYLARLTIAEISRQLASNRWAIKKRVEQLGLHLNF
jgi:hypothetical protein